MQCNAIIAEIFICVRSLCNEVPILEVFLFYDENIDNKIVKLVQKWGTSFILLPTHLPANSKWTNLISLISENSPEGDMRVQNTNNQF